MALLRTLMASLVICFCISSYQKVEAINLRELPYDVLQLIFEPLTIPDMFHVIESHPIFVEPVISAFRHAYSQKLFKINGDLFRGRKKPEKIFRERVTLRTRFFEIADYNFTIKFLNIFGNSIKNLNIVYMRMQEDQITTINGLVREKCTEKLKHFGMTFDSNHQLVPMSFPNVESVFISNANFSEPIDLSEIYPEMRRLELGNNVFELEANLKNVIDRHFPLLEHFKMRYEIETVRGETEFGLFFRKNPQLKSLAIGEITKKYMKFLQKTLPNLEYLELDDISFRLVTEPGAPIRFENVKKFTFRVYFQSDDNVMNIPFAFGDELTEVRMDSFLCSPLGGGWTRFFESNPNIEKFEFIYVTECSMFAHFPDVRMPNLKEFKLKGIDFYMEGEAEKFLSKLNQWESLETVHLVGVLRDQMEQFEVKVKAELADEWKLVKTANIDSDDLVDVRLIKA